MTSSGPPQVRPSLASFWWDVPRAGKWLLSVVIVDFIGNGLVLPFSVVYLHEVRGFDLSTTGLLLAVPAVVGLLVVGPAGVAVDRVGARRVVVVALAGQIIGQVLLAGATTVVRALLSLLVFGVASGVIWPSINAFIATVIPSEIRQRYFGVNFTLLNLGIGIGGVIGGLFVDVHHPSTFVTIYLVDAVTYLAPLAVLLGPLRHISGLADRPVGQATSRAGPTASEPPAHEQVTYWGILTRDRALRPVLVLTFVATFIGYGQLSTGIPAFGRADAQISTQTLGWSFTANTVVIVALQLFVLQRIEGRRRTRVLVGMSAIWAAAFVALGLSGLAPSTTVGSVLFVTCVAVFGFGEMFYQPTAPSMVNDLAADHLRGRYNALSSFCWQLAQVLGPPVAGLLVGRGWGSAYVVVLVAGCGAVAVLALYVEGRIPAAVNGIHGVEVLGVDGEEPDAATPAVRADVPP